jgi:arabinoxylan arabinofuranohydrolase
MTYNGRVYLYGTDDSAQWALTPDTNNSYGACKSVVVVSSDDMVNWTDHGKVPVARDIEGGATTWATNSWAPAAAHKVINGQEKFFLYFADNAGGIGVLTADSPAGPFTDPLGRALISRSTPNCGANVVPWLFDPAVFIDDDGKAYLYFGGGVGATGTTANNPKSGRCVQLGDDMISIVGTPVEIDAPGLFEDSGIHKYNGVYYYSYCSNFSATNVSTGTIHYMVSDKPLGPFTYVGAILPGPGVFGNGDGGNNHHAIFEKDGRWFITYHTRQVNIAQRLEEGKTGHRDYRSPSITEIFYESTGKIIPLQMERNGVAQTKTMDPYQRIEAETIGWQHGVSTAVTAQPGPMNPSVNMALTKIDSGSWVALGQVDFGDNSVVSLSAEVAGRSGGTVEIRLDRLNGSKVGELTVPAGNGTLWQTVSANLEGVSGTHDVYFVFSGSGTDQLFDIDCWMFAEKSQEGFRVSAVSTGEGGTSKGAVVKIENYTESDVACSVILAVYDSSGKLVGSDVKAITAIAGKSMDVNCAVSGLTADSNRTAKVMVWSADYVPLVDALSLD